jgi:hypothetical protein
MVIAADLYGRNIGFVDRSSRPIPFINILIHINILFVL